MTIENPEVLQHAQFALALQREGRWDYAIQSYRTALFLDPEFIPAYVGLAESFRALGNSDEAVMYYEQALSFAPDDGEIHYGLGLMLAGQHQYDAAAEHYARAIELLPGLAATHNNLGMIRKLQGRYDDARVHYEQALARDPQSVQVHNNLGALSYAQNNLDEAMHWYRRALELAPDSPEILHNLGDVLADRGDMAQALALYDRALAIRPDLHLTIYSKATVQLALGDFEHGWEGYDMRWATNTAGKPTVEYPWPPWNGKKPAHGKVIIGGDQGMGDEIMFAGLIPDALRELGESAVIDCANARLKPLFQRSFPSVKVFSYGEDPGPDITAQIVSPSLPRLFRRSEKDFSKTTSPYLIADPAMVSEFREKYQGGAKKIGIAWHTKNQREGHWRSIQLSEFAPLFSAFAPDQAQWISLQYGDQDKLAAEINHAGAPVFLDRSVDQLQDMDRFAAQVAAMDLVISIDNTTAHLAGALGIPAYVLLPTVPNWRWLLGRPDSPWYPSVTLFRQTAPGDWASVIQKITLEF